MLYGNEICYHHSMFNEVTFISSAYSDSISVKAGTRCYCRGRGLVDNNAKFHRNKQSMQNTNIIEFKIILWCFAM